MNQRFLIIPVLAGVTLVTGCATKGFVREELQKTETKVDQRVGKLETDVGQEKDRVSGVLVQVKDVRSLADEARARGEQAGVRADEAATKAAGAWTKADQASGTAEQALAKAEQTDSRWNRAWANRFKRNLAETAVINFGFDRWDLDDGAQTALLDVVKQLKENPNLVVDLEGFTDGQGPAPYNVQLSQRRVEAVRRFLVEKGVELPRVQAIGLGKTQPVADNSTRDGRAQNRRVVIKLFTPTE